jgi:hypothetical protein
MEPARSFQGAASKINWSNKLIDLLKEQIAEFVKLEPYEIAIKANPGAPG